MKRFLVLLTMAAFSHAQAAPQDSIKHKLAAYKTVSLYTDLSGLDIREREGIKLLIKAAEQIDQIFMMQAYAGGIPAVDTISNPDYIRYRQINYGPWDRLNNNQPFIKGAGAKPDGANFYPADMRKSEFDSLNDPRKSDPYTIVTREDGQLKVVPYHEAYRHMLTEASMALNLAADFFKDSMFSLYLRARAEALLSDQFDMSDRIWLDMKDNRFDIIIGPIENYEDKLYGTKTAYEAYILVKDLEWSKKLEKYVAYLPELQKNMPVDGRYKAESPGSSSQLNAYDIIYYAGDCNSGSKTIAVNLPNDEKLQLEKGTRRSQFKNTIKAKFDHILLPIAELMVSPEQRKHVTFNAFFSNTMFHEVAHGLGIKNTVNGKGTVREALGPHYSALEEGKADILGLYMVTELFEKKVLTEGDIMDYYVTFMAGIFRSVRFGAASAHGQANMVRFNYFLENGAFRRDSKTGFYSVDLAKMKLAMASLSELILRIQGDGDLEGLKKLTSEKGFIRAELQKDLNKLSAKNIPVDVVFDQGIHTLNLDMPPVPNQPALSPKAPVEPTPR